MSRVQLALNVSNLDAAVAFYSDLFNVPVHKRRPGYANFVVADPPLKLALFETSDRGSGVPGALNHIGVEVKTPAQVGMADERLGAFGYFGPSRWFLASPVPIPRPGMSTCFVFPL